DEYIAYTPAVNGTEGRKAEGTITEDGAAVAFVNTEKTVSFSVTKEWQGDIGDAITLTLYGNGEKLNPQPSYNKNGDVYSYENLPQYDADGKTIVYSAKEKYMDGFMTIYRNKAPYTEETGWIYNGGTIINRAVTEFRVQKVWEGLEEGEEIPEITLTLYCNGEAMDKKTPKPDEDGWYVWYNLPIVRNGETAKYSVMEEPVDGFTVTYGEDKEATCAYNGDTIVNRKIPKTGDDSRIGLWLAVTAVSAAGCILLMKKRKEAQ
ncbi:MAG: Cna B-type domain-containing protein, partial [Clostridia bacterium]|nr:Cna B-type domain-containing protein [Clostridia bacterium]